MPKLPLSIIATEVFYWEGIAMVQEILDAPKIKTTLNRLAHEIIEQTPKDLPVTLVGMQNRCDVIANILAAKIEQFAPDKGIKVVSINPRAFRDDLTEEQKTRPKLFEASLIENQIVIIVDDVLYTGRTMRAAIDGVLASGRAKQILLAALVDRGHREIPLKPDFVGKNLPTKQDESIRVVLDKAGTNVISVQLVPQELTN